MVAERISDAVDEADTVARFGGDKFVVVRSGSPLPEEVSAMAAHVLERLSQPFVVGGAAHHVTASIGAAVAQPGDGTSPDDLVRNADTAMYRAKAEGRARCVVYDAGMRDRVVARVDMERDLRRAIETDQLELVYQPIVELDGGRLVGAEALLRFNRPDQGVILPGDFLPVAEEAGLTRALGDWVVTRALDDLSVLAASARLPDGFRLWVNAFPHQTADRSLPETLADGLARRGLPPDLLGLEIVEEALADLSETIAVLTDLRSMGIAATLDDFGAGHSNLAWLQDLPITALKIDRRFVTELDLMAGGKGALIVQGLIALGKALGLVLLGEGVERPAQAELLRRLGCDWAQGYHFGRPARRDQLCQPMSTGTVG
jgi:predicted signal transduction protein with EAL and GGDEF domain